VNPSCAPAIDECIQMDGQEPALSLYEAISVTALCVEGISNPCKEVCAPYCANPIEPSAMAACFDCFHTNDIAVTCLNASVPEDCDLFRKCIDACGP
jgi:hypothetical protein